MKTNDDTQASRREERWFLVRLLLIGVLIVGGTAALLGLRAKLMPRSEPHFVFHDGTVLVLRGMSVGTTHEVKVRYPIDRQILGQKTNYVDTLTTQEPRLVLWLGYEDGTGQPLEMNWFRRAELSLSESETLHANSYYRTTQFSRGGTSTSSTDDEGFTDCDGLGTHIACSLSLMRLDFPLFRPTGPTLALRLFDATDRPVGTLELPSRLLTFPAPTWVPDPLPATRADGDVEVTLKSVSATLQEKSRLNVQPQLSITHRGIPSSSWNSHVEFQDELGNISQAWNCNLSHREPAWLMRVTLNQRLDGKLLPEECLRLAPRPVHPAGQVLRLAETHRVNGAEVTLVAWGGTGPQTFQLAPLAGTIVTGAFQPGQNSSGISVSCDGAVCDIELNCGHPFLATTMTMPNDTSTQVVFRNSDGKIFPNRGSSSSGSLQFWFFEPEQVTSPVEIEIIVQKRRHVEFWIAPPKPTVALEN